MSVFVRQNSTVSSFKNSESWTINSDIEAGIKEKIDKVGVPLKDWDIRINYGIKTGFNDAFIIDGKTRAQLINADPKSAEIIRPILRGRDIKRYACNLEDIWLISMHNGVKEKGIKRIEVSDYPAIKNHLDQFYPNLEKRADKGDTPYNLRNCAYIDDFSKQKVVWKRVGSILRFALDDSGALALDSTCFATGSRIKFLVAALNSKMGHYLLKESPKTGTGDLLISVQAIEPIKIPIPNEDIITQIECYVSEIISGDNDNAKYENLVDNMIYKLYNLSPEEVEFIDSLKL